MVLQHGFKAKAKRLALEVRKELNLGPNDEIDPYALAKLYGVDVCTLAESGLPVGAVSYFTTVGSAKFSAALVPIETGCYVVENHTHNQFRRRSTMAHEMAHVLLEHEFNLLITDDKGCRSSYSVAEEEAAEFSGELLIPWEGARWAAFKRWSDDEVAKHFNVSIEMARWRMNSTGVRRFAERARKRYR
ncbi:ImmA/IrrE family metallo-endopeptidase [Amycolatopsis rhabdoformis]|uniref:ImmA/IrrE family metallo-endopeptidase n=1 Tax=Amycolatopsis rhabdoformis TaxID=1448059 RepID=A0ABZ1ILC5_9PSEU|nr:ImmA/IrrE family metallo-endopeptidase [Amycolatopsis rhabdoformis]WSE35000.1 ImmA/IrrE family metallo-endopeptidase [Amycolatopsis rhabdoformis]